MFIVHQKFSATLITLLFKIIHQQHLITAHNVLIRGNIVTLNNFCKLSKQQLTCKLICRDSALQQLNLRVLVGREREGWGRQGRENSNLIKYNYYKNYLPGESCPLRLGPSVRCGWKPLGLRSSWTSGNIWVKSRARASAKDSQE